MLAASKDIDSSLTFRSSCILSLTTYAQMTFVLSTSPWSSVPVASNLLQECNTALKRTIALVEEVSQREFLTMNGILGVSILCVSIQVG